MDEQPLIKSDRTDTVALVIFSLVPFACIAAAVFMFANAFGDVYPDLGFIAAGSFFTIIALFFLWLYTSVNNFEIYHDRLLIFSFLGYTRAIIFLSEIISWNEIEVSGRYGYAKSKNLILYTNTGKYRISSGDFRNYEQMRNLLIKGKPQNTRNDGASVIKKLRYFSLMLLGFGLGILLFGYFSLQDKEPEVSYSQLASISGIISSKPILNRDKNSHSITLTLRAYPNFYFVLSGYVISIDDAKTFVAEAFEGDSIKIDILTDAYQKKLTHEKPLGFWDKSERYRFINIFRLQTRDQTYDSLDLYNEYHAGKPKSYSVGLIIAGVMVAFWGLVILFSLLMIKRADKTQPV